MHDHALTADELAAMTTAAVPRQATAALTHFNRMIYGRRAGDQLVTVKAVTGGDEEYRPEQGSNAPKMYTPRQVNQARGIGFAMREAYRRANWQARQLENEAATASAPAYQWKPDRPARRAGTR